MKKIALSLIAFCIVTSSLMAQTVLNAPDTNPVAGDVVIYNLCDPLTSFGLPGAGQTWDLSGLVTGSNITFTFSTTAGTTFPGSSVKMSGTFGDTYFTTSASSFEMSGSEFPGFMVSTYWDNEKYLNYPFQMGDSFTDNWAYADSSVGTGIEDYVIGTSIVTADGYGTIILPSGTFTNVLRVKSVKNYMDSSITGGGNSYTSETDYQWYKPGNHMPIAGVSMASVDGGTPDSSAFFLGAIASSVKDIYENELAKITLYPNPAINTFIVDMKSVSDNVTFSLSDISGREKQLNVTRTSPSVYTIIPAEIAEGFYILSIMDKGEIIGSKKIQLLH